jgi:hypothetical protein
MRPILWTPALLALLLITTTGRLASAAWPNQSTTNLPISAAAGQQQLPTIASDGVGGAIIAWQDSRSGTLHIYAQHVLSSGLADPAWPANGRPVCTAINTQDLPIIASDGAGGAIVAWEDFRTLSTYDIYAQHVLVSGVVDPTWPTDGRALCTAVADQRYPVIVSDGAGGAIVSWIDSRNANPAVYAQHVLASGAVDPAWPVDGRVVCSAFAQNMKVVSDGLSGAIITWMDGRSAINNEDIFAQHVLASGTVDPLWPVDGRGLCTAAGDQVLPNTNPPTFYQPIASDGAGGAIVTWADFRGGGTSDVYAQHVLASGIIDPAWPANGRALCTAANLQDVPNIVSDGAGGGIVAWSDLRGGAAYDIYAQHVLASGAVDAAWPVDGRALCTAASYQLFASIISDGAGGALVAWTDYRSGGYDLYAQHVLSTGVVDVTWPTNGRGVSTAGNDQYSHAIVSDGAGGLIATWQDFRNGDPFNNDVYAQRVARSGYLGSPEPEIVSVRDVPNDEGGKVKLSWNGSYLDPASDPNLSLYDVLRSVPPNLATARIARGARAIRSLDEPMSTGDDQLFVTTTQAQTFYWEFLASVTPLHYVTTYSYLAPTVQDSTAAGAPETAFMVVARNAARTIYWPSRPESAYSVDNLAPTVPGTFAADYWGGAAHLHWSVNTEPDFDRYRLYRGSTSGFAPSSDNQIAETTDTVFVDDGPVGGYYKLSAVDTHGNQSGFALVASAGGAGGDLVFDPPRPNPTSRGTTLHFVLPREAFVSLAVFDANGRRVRELLKAVIPAGEHTLRWDLRDQRGRSVGAGLYFAALEAEGRKLVHRLAAAR